MRVSIVGAGMTSVAEHWSRSLRELAAEAGKAALADAGLSTADALYVGNAYGATFNHQTQLGSLIADEMQLKGIEAFSCEAGEASGGVALRCGYLAVASGMVRTALVIGVEKATDIVGPARVSARSVSLDADMEGINGATPTAMAGMVMRRYMDEYGVDLGSFEGFSINAHRNGAVNPLAMYRNRMREGAFVKAPMIADPVSLFDGAPDGDGAAAIVLTRSDVAEDLAPQPVRILSSAVKTDRFMLQDREDPLWLEAVADSASTALANADIAREEVDLLEIHDAFTILTALSLEAMGYSERGRGWSWAQSGGAKIARDAELPISTFGGHKSRGNPAGASGIYQAVEAVLQLRGGAGANQAPGAKTALIQNMAGLGSTVVTHILRG